MKVCKTSCALISGHYPPSPGGVSDYTDIFAQFLSKRGYDVHILTSDTEDKQIRKDTANVHEILWDMPQIKSVLKRIRPSFINLQYTPFMYSKPGFNVWMLPLLRSIKRHSPKFVTTYHEVFNEFNLLRPKYLPLSLMQYCSFAAISFISDFNFFSVSYYRDIAPFYIRRKCYVLPVGSNIISNGVTGLEDITNEKFVIAIFGAFFHPYRRFETAFHAISILPEEVRRNVQLLILGDVGTHPDIQRMLKDFHLCEIAEVTGRLSREDVLKRLSHSDLFVLFEYVPGGRNGIGLRNGSLLAALSANLPCLINTGKHTDKALHKLCFTVDNLSPDVVASAITRAYENRGDLIRKRREINNYYAKHLHWDKIIDRFLGIIQEA